jgi:selenocysteine-specific elongation factor
MSEELDLSAPDLVLGTAGHIDHGKSSLVLALTGTDPDRLAAEKQRGITIELGFAKLELPSGLAMGVVDVPGHERFVRQMIAGATGIDIALLCIATDDGVMPQTEEHLAVLTLLGVPKLIVALTKSDLVDAEWLEFVSGEVQARLGKTPYAGSPIIAVSSRTGEGLDQLKAILDEAAGSTKRESDAAAFRLPVDRSFAIKGAGTVVTGTLWSGKASVGDEVEILPAGKTCRIRSIQVHNQPVQSAGAGHRTALNLNGISTDEVRPGDFLCTPGTLTPSDHFDVEFTYLGAPGSEKPLESGARVHVAHGTKELVGRVLLMDGESIAPGSTALAQIRTEGDLAVARGDRFIVRSYSPVHVVGGGQILRAHPRRSTNLTDGEQQLVEALRAGDSAKAVRAVLESATYPLTAAEVATQADLTQQQAESELEALAATGNALHMGDAFATKPMAQKLTSAIENTLMKFHAANPQATGMSKGALAQAACPKCPDAAFDAVLAYACDRGKAVFADGEVSHPTEGAGARKLEQQAADALASALQAAGTTPLAAKDLIGQAGLTPQAGFKALGKLEQDGRAVKINNDLYFDAAVFTQFESALRAKLAAGPASAADLKDAMGTSRKFAIPLLEYFDAQGITRRVGDARELVG